MTKVACYILYTFGYLPPEACGIPTIGKKNVLAFVGFAVIKLLSV